MTSETPGWVSDGRGSAPSQSWSFATDAPLVEMQLARETGELLACDASGGMYLLDRQGHIVTLTRGFHSVEALAWSDVGNRAVAAVDQTKLVTLSADLKVRWSLEMPEPILAVAIDPHGHYIAVCMADAVNRLYDIRKRQLAEFATSRPLSCLRFIATEPAFIAAAEYGLLGYYELLGREIWAERLWSNVGDLAITGDGKRIHVAGFNRGIQVFDHDGENLGSYVVEGTPSLVTASFAPRRLAVMTLERHLYWLDHDGEIIWVGSLPDDVRRISCDPLGEGMIVGFESGRIIRLDWHVGI